MKDVKDLAFQGDVMFRKVDKLPEGAKEANENMVVAHSETGHHHVAQGGKHFNSDDVMISFLTSDQDIKIKHLRDHDTHETLNLLADGGGTSVWEIRRQREHAPDGWRKAQD